MANATRKLNATGWAYVRSDNPATHYNVNTSSWYLLEKKSYNSYLLAMFESMPASLKRKKLVGISVTFQARIDNGSSPSEPSLNRNLIDADPLTAAFNQSSVTYNNMPGYAGGGLRSDTITAPMAASDLTVSGSASDAHYFFGSNAMRFGSGNFYSYRPPVYVKPLLTNSAATYVTITYDSAVDVTSQAYWVQQPSDPVEAIDSTTFKWGLQKSGSNYCADETWVQSSAVFRWRAGTSGTYNQIQVSGSTMSLKVPANTFPTGKIIQCYVSVTDTDGTTTSTSVYEFNTRPTAVTPSTYPTGDSVDNRVRQQFLWYYISTLGNYYPQRSATFYWQVHGASSWNQIASTSETGQVYVPAYTFPPGSTIDWYVTGTDSGGYTSSSSVLSFKTLATSFSVTSYPSGSNIDTRSAITFSWTLSNSAGSVTQTAAKLFWRVSGSGSYTEISYTGSTKSITVPANTFPTGKTIEWYVNVWDQTGTRYVSNSRTFNTVTTKVTPDTYPSGSNIYTAAGIKWTWHLASNVGNYNQASAKLYWRVSTQQAYTSINISGNTQSLTVAANTFPTNSTIQWYLEATDVGGLTSSTSVMSFKTVSTQITPQNSPTSGYADPRNAIKFQWYFASTGGAVPQASATFYWRISGASAWTSVAASGSTTSVTIPGNTFPVASTIEWYISGTDIGGTSSTSQEYSFSTAAETAYAYPQAPIGVTVDTGKPVTLRWILANADGTLPSHVELSYKTPDDSSWTVIHEADSAFTAWTTDANYFPVGEIEWRVIATNRDGIAGPAGTAAFISLRAPDAPVGLTATAVPRTTIRWQGGDQEAYEIIIDGETVRQAYGTEVNEWTPDFVLEDGIHVIAVRIQGLYGLWSDPAVTTIDVQNEIPEGWEDLSLSGKLDVDAILTMDGAESPAWSTANWFRDGKRIAVTHGSRTYTDRYVLGEHSWYVELWSADGYYARSNIVTGTLKSCITRIALFEGGDWVDLRLSENSAGLQGFQYGRTNSARHVLGTAYPVLELSEFEDLSGSYDCAFRDVESEAKLEAMRGKVVILKSRGGRVLIGLLSPLETRYTDFYISCSFTVQGIAWEDFRDVL